MTPMSILQPGRNCWRIAHADRVAFLIDGADYFRAFREAAKQARRSIMIVGWDLDSRVRLVSTPVHDGFPASLGEFLNFVVARTPGLHAYLLCWDFAMIYALDREWLPIYHLDWKAHRRVHFHMDDRHPLGASHHQKIVVIDDAVAFVGGLDLTKGRRDTPEHRPHDLRRIDPEGNLARPFHDVQMLVDGEAAAALGELARERWRRATRHHLPSVPNDAHAVPWPAQVETQIADVDVAISRTEPTYDGKPEVREVERLYCDAIAAARHSIYIENQYFTSNAVSTALASRLAEPDAPEVVIVLGLTTDGWLAQSTMDVMRIKHLRRLRDADRNGRLRVYYPAGPEKDGQPINVHAKVLIVDDRFARVGSSNLSNRSMGLDTECDLAIETNGKMPVAVGIAAFRDRLLAEHLGCVPAKVADSIARHGSLLAAIEALRNAGRSLQTLEVAPSSSADAPFPATMLADPERPLDPDLLVEEFVPQGQHRHAHRRLVAAVGIVTALLVTAAAWRWSPLGDWLDPESLSAAAAAVRASALAPVWIVLIYVVGGLVVFPVTVLIVATVITFPGGWGFVYALAGVLASAAATYAMGAALGRSTVRRLAGSRINRISQRLAKRGLLTIVFARVVPIAPFTVINLVAGASHIRLRDYLLGTLAGAAPGIAAIALLENRIEAALTQPDALNIGLFAAATGLLTLVIVGLRKWLTRSAPSRADSETTERQDRRTR